MRVGKEHAETLLASLLWLTMIGCATTTVPEFTGTLGPGEELVTLSTRPGVTVKILFLIPNAVPKGAFLFFPGGEGYLATPEGRPKALYSRLFPGQGFEPLS